jgi:excisionase family DNA binding protein
MIQYNKTELVVKNKIEPALLTIPQVCKLLNISRAEFYRLGASGKFAPLQVGLCRKVLYRRTEIEDWVNAGCPHRRTWPSGLNCKYFVHENAEAKARKLSLNPAIIAAIIVALVQIAVCFINPYANNLINPPQKNVAISLEIVTNKNYSPAFMNYGLNNQVNIYQIPSQSETNLEVRKMDVNPPKDFPVNNSKALSKTGY